MYQVGNLIRDELENLAQIESLTANKPIRDARVEVLKVAEMFEYYAGWADKLHGEIIPVPTTHLNYVTYEPLGTVLQITPGMRRSSPVAGRSPRQLQRATRSFSSRRN